MCEKEREKERERERDREREKERETEREREKERERDWLIDSQRQVSRRMSTSTNPNAMLEVSQKLISIYDEMY